MQALATSVVPEVDVGMVALGSGPKINVMKGQTDLSVIVFHRDRKGDALIQRDSDIVNVLRVVWTKVRSKVFELAQLFCPFFLRIRNVTYSRLGSSSHVALVIFLLYN